MTTSEACKMIKKELQKIDKKVRVYKGTGTACGWVNIYTSIAYREVENIIERMKKENGLRVSTYYGDMDTEPTDCISINREDR